MFSGVASKTERKNCETNRKWTEKEKALKYILRWCSCDNKWLSTFFLSIQWIGVGKKGKTEDGKLATTPNGNEKKIWAIVMSFDYSRRSSRLFCYTSLCVRSTMRKINSVVESLLLCGAREKELRWHEIWNSSTLVLSRIRHSSVRQFIILISVENPAFKWTVLDVFTASWNWLAIYNKVLSWPLHPCGWGQRRARFWGTFWNIRFLV